MIPDLGRADARSAWTRWAIAAVAAFALADGSIVTLALPQLLQELHTSVEGVAAILVVYCAVLAATLPLARRLAARWSIQMVGIAGLALLAAASLACAASGSLTLLLVGRAGQAIGAAGALLLAFNTLRYPAASDGFERLSLWRASAIFGTAAGPAIGGALTQAFSWRAIFLVQVPIALVAAFLCATAGAPASAVDDADPGRVGVLPRQRAAAAALAATAAALSAVLFLLVLLLVIGGGLSPLHAAAVLSVLPAVAIAAARLRARAAARAAVGCVALGVALVMLAFLPRSSFAWLVVPEVLAGLGMGLALPALAGELLPERSIAQASRLLTIRFAGIAITLIALAPLIAGQLHRATDRGRLQGVAALVASPLSPGAKLSLAPSLARSIDSDRPRQSLATTVARVSPGLSASDRRALTSLEHQGDAIIFSIVIDSLRDAFLIAAALVLIAALLVRPPGRRQSTAALAVCSLLLSAAFVLAAIASRPALPAVDAPCRPERVPDASGIEGLLQSGAITVLDWVACARNVSREQLLLQIAGGSG
ncbi:MAG TPA: MFS transporter [Solirubrobacteraceae bacterium]